MKFKHFYAIALLALFLTSCSKDQISIEDRPSENVSLDIPDFDKMSETEIEAFFTSPEMLADDPDDEVDVSILNATPTEDNLVETISIEDRPGIKHSNKRAASVTLYVDPDIGAGDYWTLQQKTSSGWQSIYFGTADNNSFLLPVAVGGSECIYQYQWRVRMYDAGCNDLELIFSKGGCGFIDVDTVITVSNSSEEGRTHGGPHVMLHCIKMLIRSFK